MKFIYKRDQIVPEGLSSAHQSSKASFAVEGVRTPQPRSPELESIYSSGMCAAWPIVQNSAYTSAAVTHSWLSSFLPAVSPQGAVVNAGAIRAESVCSSDEDCDNRMGQSGVSLPVVSPKARSHHQSMVPPPLGAEVAYAAVYSNLFSSGIRAQGTETLAGGAAKSDSPRSPIRPRRMVK